MRAVVCPISPLLFPGAAGQADPLRDLRAACVAAVRDLAATSDRVLALCPAGIAGAPADYRRPDGTGSGPLSRQVARHLLDAAGARLPVDLRAPEDVEGRAAGREEALGLLVLGEGTACGRDTGLGRPDDRCAEFDDRLAAALAGGDGGALAGLDQRLAADLMVTGRAGLAVLGRLMPTARGTLLHRSDPFGVTYLVASWR